jgi:hypothetical protein
MPVRSRIFAGTSCHVVRPVSACRAGVALNVDDRPDVTASVAALSIGPTAARPNGWRIPTASAGLRPRWSTPSRSRARRAGARAVRRRRSPGRLSPRATGARAESFRGKRLGQPGGVWRCSRHIARRRLRNASFCVCQALSATETGTWAPAPASRPLRFRSRKSSVARLQRGNADLAQDRAGVVRHAASAWARNASSGRAGRLRTKSASESANSGRLTYISGVEHSGKIA